MLSAFIGGVLDVLIENLPQLEQMLGRAAFLVEVERLLHALANATLAVQQHRARLVELMRQNDDAIAAASKKDPHNDGGGGNG